MVVQIIELKGNVDRKCFGWMDKREKGESQNGGNKKIRHAKFSEKQTFLTPWYHKYMCVSGGKKCSFSENLACFVFL